MLVEFILISILLQPYTFAKITREADGFFSCPEDPITLKYPDPSDKTCILYYLCHRGHAFPMSCPLRYAFHPAIGNCIPRDQVPENVCQHQIKCGFNGYYPDPVDCTRYFICFYQNPVHFGCNEGHIFDKASSQCKADSEAAKACSVPRPLPQFTPTLATTPKPKTATPKVNVTISTKPTTPKMTTTTPIPTSVGEQKVMVL